MLKIRFLSATASQDNDWILVIDDSSKTIQLRAKGGK
jgi:hypothetical protein